MEQRISEPDQTERPLSMEDQQAVMFLATRLQQEREEGATLSDLVSIGLEAGLSQEAVEEANRRITTQSSEKEEKEQMGRTLGNELAAIYLTTIWALATWAGVMLFRTTFQIAEWIALLGTFLIVPSIIGVLVRRPWVAAAFGAVITLSLLTVMAVRHGPPQPQWVLWLFLAPVILAPAVSVIGGIVSKARPQKTSMPSKNRE